MASSQDLFSKYEQTIKDDYSIVQQALQGLSASAFYDLVLITKIGKSQLAEDIFQFSLKTVKRYEENDRKLTPRNSELMLKLIALFKKGVEVFGSIDHFKNWLHKPAYGLGGKVPYQMMNISTGVDLIFEELVRIEFGDLA